MPQTPSSALAPFPPSMEHGNWNQIDMALSGIIGSRGLAALHQRLRHRCGTTVSSPAIQQQAFWSLTAELLGASLTDRLFHRVMGTPALASGERKL